MKTTLPSRQHGSVERQRPAAPSHSAAPAAAPVQLQRSADSSPRVARQQALASLADDSARTARHRSLGDLANGPLQRKRNYLNPGPNHVDKAWDLVRAFEEREGIAEPKRLDRSQFLYGLSGLTVSPIDYGTIDLDSPQHAGLLYFAIRKQAGNFPGMKEKELAPVEAPDGKRQQSIDDGRIAKQEGEQRDRDEAQRSADEAYLKKSPDAAHTYELVFVGAGPAVAYYLASMAERIDPARTVVIGERQPWAGKRGPGVVNHPKHMISAQRDNADLGDESLMPRDDFAQDIDAAIAKRVWRRIEQKVTKVDKVTFEGMPFYQIDLDDGRVFYGQKVVAGLGIGPHVERHTWAKDSPVAVEHKPRVMDMDMFQNRAADLRNERVEPPPLTVFIAGGNAAIDVATTCLQYGFKIIWYPGNTAPQFLQGTDNELVQQQLKLENPDAEPGKERYVLASGSRIAKYEQTRAGAIGAGTGNYPLSINGNNAHYFVYGQGPDVAAVSGIFHKEHILDKLVGTTDKNLYFHAKGAAKTRLEEAKGDNDRATLGLQMPRSESDPTSLEIIGGSAFRLPITKAEVDTVYKSLKKADKDGTSDEILRTRAEELATQSRKQGYEAVIASMPANVAGNDQLAAIRAQVEASHGFVPSYVEDDVNLAVDSITVIAIHIATKYPNLSEEQANLWADRIIRWRRPGKADIEQYRMLQGPIPNPNGKPRENARSFSAWFKRRLAEENAKAQQQ